MKYMAFAALIRQTSIRPRIEAARSGKFVVAFLLMFAAPSAANDKSDGLTKAVNLPPFNPARPFCAKPKGLKRKLVFVQDNEREFIQGVGRGLASAAAQRGISYSVSFSGNNAALMI